MKFKLMMITLMMCFMTVLSFGQDNQSPTEKSNWETTLEIQKRLQLSSDYLIKANDQLIAAAFIGVFTSVLTSAIILQSNGSNHNSIIVPVAVVGGISIVTLSISSLVNKRKGYNALSNNTVITDW